MIVRDVVEAIERFAPASIQESWDNTGLQVGNLQDEVHGILVGFDCTADLVREAVQNGCDMVVTHHPLLFSGLKRVDREDPVGEAVIEAVKNGVAVYSAHTSADKVPQGVSFAMASRLGLENVRILCEDGPDSGLGAIGDFPKAMPAVEALKLVKKAFSLDMMRTSRIDDVMVKNVAMCGGSGSSLIEDARAQGAQLYLCGDISYHHFFTPDGFILADIGHFESEVDIVGILCELLRKNFPNFAVRASARETNPVNYF